MKNIVKNPNIIVGDYTYYDDPVDVHNFEQNVLYHFDFIGDKLIIGKFCQIATGVKFVMNGGNHDLNGFSSFPFIIFQSYWPEVPFIPNADSKVKCNKVAKVMGLKIDPKVNLQSIGIYFLRLQA